MLWCYGPTLCHKNISSTLNSFYSLILNYNIDINSGECSRNLKNLPRLLEGTNFIEWEIPPAQLLQGQYCWTSATRSRVILSTYFTYFLLLSVFLLVFQTLIYSCKVCEFWIIKVQQQTPKKMLHFFLHFRQRLNLQFYVVFKMFICCGLLHSIKSTVYLYKNIFLCLVFTSLIQISSFSLPTL